MRAFRPSFLIFLFSLGIHIHSLDKLTDKIKNFDYSTNNQGLFLKH